MTHLRALRRRLELCAGLVRFSAGLEARRFGGGRRNGGCGAPERTVFLWWWLDDGGGGGFGQDLRKYCRHQWAERPGSGPNPAAASLRFTRRWCKRACRAATLRLRTCFGDQYRRHQAAE